MMMLSGSAPAVPAVRRPVTGGCPSGRPWRDVGAVCLSRTLRQTIEVHTVRWLEGRGGSRPGSWWRPAEHDGCPCVPFLTPRLFCACTTCAKHASQRELSPTARRPRAERPQLPQDKLRRPDRIAGGFKNWRSGGASQSVTAFGVRDCRAEETDLVFAHADGAAQVIVNPAQAVEPGRGGAGDPSRHRPIAVPTRGNKRHDMEHPTLFTWARADLPNGCPLHVAGQGACRTDIGDYEARRLRMMRARRSSQASPRSRSQARCSVQTQTGCRCQPPWQRNRRRPTECCPSGRQRQIRSAPAGSGRQIFPASAEPGRSTG